MAHIIDCDADPHLPKGWSIESHNRQGKIVWSPEHVELYVPDAQLTGLTGFKLREELGIRPVFNACLLDYLLKSPELILPGWAEADTSVLFWGTIYSYKCKGSKKPCIRYLFSRLTPAPKTKELHRTYDWGYLWLGHRFVGEQAKTALRLGV